MTNEQRKAIKTIKIYLHDWRDSLTDEDGYSAIVEEYDIEFMNAIDTVLSLIKEQQEEIEGVKDKEVLIKRYFKKCDLIKQKDKQIELMARAIDNYDSQLEINTFKDKEHIKQYFVDLVEKE